ncbi:MAG: PadR family transcriptional regulator [Terracidiphilus sp.]
MKTKSTLEYALAGLLRPKAQSGYDLRKTFTTTGMRHYSDSPGSIYPALKRLEKRGWIEAVPRREEEDDPRKRQLFAITEAGKEALVVWLRQPVTRDYAIYRVSELMLRFAFMDGNVPRTATVQFLLDFEREMAVYAAESRGKLEEMRSKFPVHTGVLAYEAGIEGMEAQVNWARRSRERLEQAQSEPASPAKS